MSFCDKFEVASGTVIGAEHIGSNGVLCGGSNQDSYGITSTDRFIAGVVCDGCSDRRDSGVGSALLSRMFLSSVEEVLGRDGTIRPEQFAVHLNQKLLKKMEQVANALTSSGISFIQVMDELFLATIVGFVMRPTSTEIFACGDGLWALNGTVNKMGPFPENAPPYLAYNLRDQHSKNGLEVVTVLPTHKVQTLLVGSDGCADLADVLPYTREDKYFTNPVLLSRELRQLNRENVALRSDCKGREATVRIDWEEKKLRDDTTLIAVRRKVRAPVFPKVVAAPVQTAPPTPQAPPAKDPPKIGLLPKWLGG